MSVREPDTTPVRQALVTVVAEILPDIPATQVTDEKTLRDLGADSVERVEIITALADLCGCPDPISSFADATDIGELLRRLAGRRNAE